MSRKDMPCPTGANKDKPIKDCQVTEGSKNDKLNLTIHNAGFTEAATKLFQRWFKNPLEKDAANRALIATRLKMLKYARNGSMKAMIKAQAKTISELPVPFTVYYENQEPPLKRLLQLMNTCLPKKQLIEAFTMCIKNDLKSKSQTHKRNIARAHTGIETKENVQSTPPNNQKSNLNACQNKEEQNKPEAEITKRYYKFPPIEIPYQGCEQCITNYADKFFCVGCFLIFDTHSEFIQHRKKSKKCNKMCGNWQNLRFEPGHEFEHQLIYASRQMRPKGQ